MFLHWHKFHYFFCVILCLSSPIFQERFYYIFFTNDFIFRTSASSRIHDVFLDWTLYIVVQLQVLLKNFKELYIQIVVTTALYLGRNISCWRKVVSRPNFLTWLNNLWRNRSIYPKAVTAISINFRFSTTIVATHTQIVTYPLPCFRDRSIGLGLRKKFIFFIHILWLLCGDKL